VTRTIQKRALALAVGTALGTVAAAVQASGFQLMEQSASGLGLAFAGMAAAGQDASTAFWNPAAMSLLPGVQGAAVLSYIAPTTEYKDSGSSTFSALGDGGSDGAPNAWVPALYATWMLTPDWSVGLAVNAPFGLATEWDKPWAGQFHAVKSEIETLNINPVVSFKVNEMLTLGAGLSYQQIKAELTSAVGFAPPNTVFVGKIEGDDWELGWNVGALIDFQQGTRIGLTYRSTIDYTLTGDFRSPQGKVPVSADVKLPDTFSVGLSHQFTPDTRVLADWTWTGWDSIQDLPIEYAGLGVLITNTTLKFDNSWRAGLGVEHQLDPSWLLRAGVAYDNTPVQDEYRTPRLPDEDRTWLALGVRYQPEQNAAWWVDVGYAHLWVDDAESNLPLSRQGSLIGKYEANIDLFAAQVSFRF
jgi:long-chain fatty acid transport protein